MYKKISNLLFDLIKPIAIKVLQNGNYPQDAIERKCANIPEDGFKKEDHVIMVHGVSVGETNALENLIKTIRKEFPESKLVYTTGTWTGQDLAKKKLGDYTDLITYFPADFPKIVEKFFDKINPDIVMIAETEIWPNFAIECKNRGIKLYVINGRISDNTFKTYEMFKFIFKPFLKLYSGIFTQSTEDNNKFLKLGASPETTKRMNNLKFDIKQPEELSFDKTGARVFLAGSTHQGEDEIVLENFRKLKANHNDLKLIIAPRHLTRVEEVKSLVEKFGFVYDLRSNSRNSLNGIDVMILDTLGELGKMYRFADLSFIGGSFNKTGGHNPLESIVFNVPVISGPSIHNFKDIYAIIKNADAGFVVEDEKEFLEISDKILSDKIFYSQTVDNCVNVFNEQQGALQFVIDVLKNA
ncbi:MAG: 3-deoxy-D-manno-octulosonic acid transferase [Cyanobacteria bacterium SIG31]|nr:3-deoxy-D-manno-octulosonic acid transferase [Cyanobacteria bacterium SIG31]